MITIIIIIIGVFLIFVMFSKTNLPKSNHIKIEVDVPHPEKCQDKTMIDFIETTPNYKLEPVFKEYAKRGLILKPLYLEAYHQKINNGKINLKEFYSKFRIEVEGEVLVEKKILNKQIPSLREFQEEKEIKRKPISLKKWADENQEEIKNNLTFDDLMRFQTNKVDSKYYQPQIDLQDKSHELYGKKVVITGTFDSFPNRNELANLLWSVGADIDTSISRNVDIVVLGENPGWKKVELIKEFQPQVIDQAVLLELFPDYKPNF